MIKMLIRIYYKNVWTSKKLINLLARGNELKDQKVNQMVSNFLISSSEQTFDHENSGDEEENLKEMTKSL